MKKIKLFAAIFAVSVLGVFAVVTPQNVFAIDPLAGVCASNPDDPICQSSGDEAGSIVKKVVNILLFITGALAIIMIIWSGIQYTTSSGDSGKVSKAKNTLLYSVIGLIIAFLSFAIVNWVLKLV